MALISSRLPLRFIPSLLVPRLLFGSQGAGARINVLFFRPPRLRSHLTAI